MELQRKHKLQDVDACYMALVSDSGAYDYLETK